MIQSLTLNNFKTYTDQVFTFHPGINLFVGSSNNGKSQIFRALCWLINNRPMGKSVISYWNRDNKGDPVNPTKAILKADDKEIIRLRESGKNCYSFNGNEYEALRGNVPDEITTFLNMFDINIQKQKEQPFLISFTSGEVAKYLNGIIKLDVIDKCLTYVKQKKTKCETALKTEKVELESLEKELISLEWIEDADNLLMKIEAIEQERIEKESILSNLSESITRYQELQGKLKGFIDIETAELLINEIREIEKELAKSRKQCKNLSESIERYNEAQKKLKESISFLSVESIISEIRGIEVERKRCVERESKLKSEINTYASKKNQLVLIEKELVELNSKLPDVCPMCKGTGKLKKE